MPRWLAFTLFTLTILSQGCGLVTQASHVVAWRTSEAFEDHREQQRNRQWAETAWANVVCRSPYPHASDDYASGFKDGFAEYLYHGLHTLPTLPPRRYRTLENQSAQGYRAIEQWYAGYDQGMRAAEQNGFRRLVTGPTPPDRLDVPLPTTAVPITMPESGYTPAQWIYPSPQP